MFLDVILHNIPNFLLGGFYFSLGIIQRHSQVVGKLLCFSNIVISSGNISVERLDHGGKIHHDLLAFSAEYGR